MIEMIYDRERLQMQIHQLNFGEKKEMKKKKHYSILLHLPSALLRIIALLYYYYYGIKYFIFNFWIL